jgi:hypothetical protein
MTTFPVTNQSSIKSNCYGCNSNEMLKLLRVTLLMMLKSCLQIFYCVPHGKFSSNGYGRPPVTVKLYGTRDLTA